MECIISTDLACTLYFSVEFGYIGFIRDGIEHVNLDMGGCLLRIESGPLICSRRPRDRMTRAQHALVRKRGTATYVLRA